jgi:alpha-L-fucosidase 2
MNFTCFTLLPSLPRASRSGFRTTPRFFAVLFSLGSIGLAGAQDTIAKSAAIVSRHKAVFKAPSKHVPSFHAVDSPITGNGDIGLTVSGRPAQQRYWISKNDFWKSGPDYKQCGPSLIGGIDVRIDPLKDASYHVEQILYEPVIRSTFATPDTTVTMEARVTATDGIILLELTTDKQAVQVSLNLWAKDGFGSQTAQGQDGDVMWVTRKFNTSDLLFPSEAMVALRTLPASGTSFSLKPGQPLTVVAAVVTNHDSRDYDVLARAKAKRAAPAAVDRLKAAHNKWWQDFWAASYVELDDKLLEKYYYASHYIMACCSRNGKFPPGLFGNWTTSDRTAWSGDFHLNYNHEAPFWALYSSNRVSLTDCYDTPLLEHLDEFKADALKHLNQQGAYASVALGPKGLTCRFQDKAGMDASYQEKCGEDASYLDLANQPMFLGQKSNAVFASMNMILRYHYTYDLDYVAKVYPFLAAVAEFWEGYLKLENGRYVIHNDNFDEVGPWQGKNWKQGYGDINPTPSLGFLRVFFKALIGISTDLNRDAHKREQWHRILTGLSEWPVAIENGHKRFRACEGGSGSAAKAVGLDYNIMHGLVFPATNIGLNSAPDLLDRVRKDMARWTDKEWLHHGNAFQTAFIGAARVGYDPDFLFAKARAKIAVDAYPNLWIYAGGGGIETCSGIPGMINEMMLQSHDDVMRVFPVFPATQKASFYRLRTFGAFLVSSAIDNGTIAQVAIESEMGRPCVLLNPWPGKTVAIHRNGKLAQHLSGTQLQLATTAGEHLLLVPESL